VNVLTALFSRLALSSIRSRMLVIALLPALLAEFGMAAYFTTRTLATAEDALHARAINAARHLADALPYALVSGDIARVYALLKTEAENSQLSFARITDAHAGWSPARATAARSPPDVISASTEIRLPAADFSDAPCTPPASRSMTCWGVRKSGYRSTRSAHSGATP
jgi:hypothetical protein